MVRDYCCDLERPDWKGCGLLFRSTQREYARCPECGRPGRRLYTTQICIPRAFRTDPAVARRDVGLDTAGYPIDPETGKRDMSGRWRVKGSKDVAGVDLEGAKAVVGG